MLASRLERDFSFSARSIVEHGQVIARVFENRTVLPMRFGTFFRSEQQVMDLVRENRQELLEAFCRLRGKAEMRVKILLGFEPAAASAKAASVRKQPRRSMRADEPVAQTDGEALDPQCRELAEQLSSRLRELFHPVDQQVTCRRLEGSQLLVDCAHLIEMGGLPAYQKQCCQVSSQVTDGEMKVSGPWPPYHFLPNAVRLPAISHAPQMRSRSGSRLALVSH